MNKFKDPLNNLFDVLPGDEDEINDYDQVDASELVPVQTEQVPDVLDADDIEVNQKIDQVYDMAVDAYKNQTEMIEMLEPRYAARNAEVAANYLNIALSAATARGKLKIDRKKSTMFIPHGNGKVTNNTIVASRSEILRMINVDGEKKDI